MRPMLPLVFVALAAMGGSAGGQGAPAAPLQNQPPVSHFGPWLPTEQTQCHAEFTRLRLDATTRASQIKAARERKASSREACELLRGYANAEAELVKVTATCAISAHFAQQLKANHKRTNEMQSCGNAPRSAPGAAGPVAVPGLATGAGARGPA